MSAIGTRNLPRWQSMPAGMAVAALALVFLCAITQASARPTDTGPAFSHQLHHLAVASHSALLSVTEPDKLASDLLDNDQIPPVWAPTPDIRPGSRLASPVPGGASPGLLASPDYLIPPLRAPPIG
ncbi:hypothetical protein ACJO2E_14415 [Marinobacter sp. M1N3S26]|uniref:hypothetical protein n=1 Tax=Marinobacter sp. M1N3S26 TaxID=3382299 RepID=UPI00387B86C1